MKTSRRALIALATTIALAAGASAPSKAADPKERYGMVVFLKGSEFFNWAYAGFQDEAATLGATTELQGPADWDASAEARAVDQLVAKGVKGVAVTAGDADTLTASIDAGLKAKVPVLTFDSDSPKSHRLLFVGTNNYNAGYQAGLAVAKLLGDKARVGISRIPGLDSINHRVAGFTDALKKTATGALAATRNVGRDQDGPNKVYVVAWAIDVPILQGVEKGDFGMTVAQNPYMMGVQSMLELWSAAHPTQFDSMTNPGFGQVPTSDLDTGVKILVKGDPAIKALMTPPKL